MSDLGHGFASAPVHAEKSPPPPARATSPPAKSKKAQVENAVMSYVLPLAAGGLLMTLCWAIGHFGYSFVWVGIFVGLNFLKSKMWRERERRVLALQTAAQQERAVVMAQLQDLPAWVQFPDTERVEWINKVIHQLWPYIGEYSKKFIAEIVEPQVKANLPSPFKAFRFEQIDMGDIPLRVGGIKVYTENVGRDRVIMDMDVAYAGDCEFVVAVGAFRGGLNNMQFKGKLRCVLKPLLAQPPMVGGVTAFFLDDPTIDFNLTGIGEMVEIPGLMGAIRNVVTTQVRSICVLPNEIVVPLTAHTDVAALHVPQPDGVVRIGIMEARDLENLDISFIKKGKSDPYAVVAVGAQHFQTAVIDNDLNPKWNEWFEAVVDQASGQKLAIEIFDEDQGKDEELGRLTLDLDTIRRKGVSDQWYQLEGAKQGELRLKTYWMSLSTDPADVHRNSMLPEFKASKNPLKPALLLAYIDSASDLPAPKRNLEPSPFVQIRVANEIRKTFPKRKTANPLYQHKELIFVTDPEHQDIVIEAFDEGTKKSLGQVTVPLQRLLREPNMELYQHNFHLSLGAETSTLVATFRLRGLRTVAMAETTEAAKAAKAPQTSGESFHSFFRTEERVPQHVSISAYREPPQETLATRRRVVEEVVTGDSQRHHHEEEETAQHETKYRRVSEEHETVAKPKQQKYRESTEETLATRRRVVEEVVTGDSRRHHHEEEEKEAKHKRQKRDSTREKDRESKYREKEKQQYREPPEETIATRRHVVEEVVTGEKYRKVPEETVATRRRVVEEVVTGESERHHEEEEPKRKQSDSEGRVESWVESVTVHATMEPEEPVKMALRKEQEALSVRAVKRGDKEKRPTRQASDTRPPSKSKSRSRESLHKSSDRRKSQESLHKSEERLSRKASGLEEVDRSVKERRHKSASKSRERETRKSRESLHRSSWEHVSRAEATEEQRRSVAMAHEESGLREGQHSDHSSHHSHESPVRSEAGSPGNGSVGVDGGKKGAKSLTRSPSNLSRTSRSSSLKSMLSGKAKKLRRKSSLSSARPGDLGRVELRIRYSFQSSDLIVTVLQASKLRPASTDGLADPYVKLRLLRDNSEKEEFKTRIIIAELNPEFNQTFTFSLSHKELAHYSLFLKVKDGASYGLFTKPPVLGKCLYPLSEFDPNTQIQDWFELSF